MFGLVEREMNGRCYIEIVPNRKSKTLLKIIFDRVEEGTTIISDSWSSYEKLKDLNFNHLKQSNGYLRIHIKSFIDEFMWRQTVARDRVAAFNQIIQEIAVFYPADSLKNSVKRKALEIEKASYENPIPSKIASTAVSNVLEKPKGQDKIQCHLCKAVGKMKFVENDWGLKIHKSRCHKDKNVKGKK
ncbi:ISXO2-like domain-containing [Brachionus plicatilis]|uniref:ISXO2-like domain-containing n=1 Tax=Brachionus plicatilis TaxID=10195 RepID=A0A3M7SYC3_BRAPC|nr:ISXO2-like domain-containing [Brachionus plicatilis]